MQLGIMARVFDRPTLEERLDAIRDRRFSAIQFGFECAGLPGLPEQIDQELSARIRRALEARQLTMAAVSGTYNMIDPDLDKRRDGLRRLGELIAACDLLGTSIITLCTGTHDPDNMWRRHPDNDLPDAWRDLTAELSAILPLAEQHRITLGVEPEVANVVDSARKARRLLDEMQSPCLKIIVDGANLFHPGELARQEAILDEAFDLLGDAVVLAHAKDLSHDLEEGWETRWAAAGQGRVDYDRYLRLLRSSGYDGALILHSLVEGEVASSAHFLTERMFANS
jgi:sugar phosphate isomerase/epimerase